MRLGKPGLLPALSFVPSDALIGVPIRTCNLRIPKLLAGRMR